MCKLENLPRCLKALFTQNLEKKREHDIKNHLKCLTECIN